MDRCFPRDENECVKVNLNPANTERNMVMPKAQVDEYFQDRSRFRDLLAMGPPAQFAEKLKSAVGAQ